ncbi:MAG TPA: hypothetical protein VIJ34_14745 [Acidimicrobiales bacterium]
MKKLLLGVGILVGFVVGSRAGRRPYEQIESKVKDLTGRKSVHNAASSTKEAMHSASDAATTTIKQKVDEAAEHFSEAVDRSAEKITKALGADH